MNTNQASYELNSGQRHTGYSEIFLVYVKGFLCVGLHGIVTVPLNSQMHNLPYQRARQVSARGSHIQKIGVLDSVQGCIFGTYLGFVFCTGL